MLEHYTHNALNEIAHTLGLEFTNVELLGQALVHRSTRSDSTILTRGSNERIAPSSQIRPRTFHESSTSLACMADRPE